MSRLKDGTSATMAKEKVIPIIQRIIDDFNQNQIQLIIVACTGEFPPFDSKIPIIYPDYLLNHATQGIFRKKEQIGVIIPLPEQADSIQKKWHTAGFKTITVASFSLPIRRTITYSRNKISRTIFHPDDCT